MADDLVCEFEAKYVEKRDSRSFVNLGAMIKNQLLQKRIENANIKLRFDYTYCEKNKYFFYRRDKRIYLIWKSY